MKKTKILKGILTMAAALVFAVFAYSANAGDNQLKVTDGFDRYKFNSVNVTPRANSKAVTGTMLTVKFLIENGNDYPVVDGSVYVKIFKKHTTETKDYSTELPDDEFLKNGDELVDEFEVASGITLDGNGENEKEYNWKVPNYLPSGNYVIATFFQSAKRFNLLGLPFTNDILGGTTEVEIKNLDFPATDAVAFDRTKVTLNKKAYNFVGFAPIFSKDQAVTIEAPLANTTGKLQTVSLSWNSYRWDGMRADNKLDEKNEKITLGPNETKIVSYVVSQDVYPVAYVIAKANWQDRNSFLDIRFSRQGTQSARTNFMGLSAFPLQKGKPITAFLSAHAVTNFIPAIPLFNNGGKSKEMERAYVVTLSLKDKEGKIIDSSQYEGEITGEVMGLEKTLTPEKQYNYAVLEANIQDKSGKNIDSVSLIYDCEKINPKLCQNLASSLKSNLFLDGEKTPSLMKILLLFSIIPFLVLAVYLLVKKRKGMSIFLLIVLGTFAFPSFGRAGTEFAKDAKKCISGNTQEQTCKLNSILIDRAYRSQGLLCGMEGIAYVEYPYWWSAVTGTEADVTYSAKSSISDMGGASTINIPVGSEFTVSATTFEKKNSISWNTTGYSVDSPYGCWRANLDDYGECMYNVYDYYIDTEKCEENPDSYDCYRYDDYRSGDDYRYSLNSSMLFNPPMIGIGTSGPVECLPVVPGRKEKPAVLWNCKVTGTGEIKVNLSHSTTKGKFNYESEGMDLNPSPKDFGYASKSGEYQTKLNCNCAAYAQGEEGNRTPPLLPTYYKTPYLVEKYKQCSNVKYRNWMLAFVKGSPFDEGITPCYCSACGSSEDNALVLPEVKFEWKYVGVGGTNNPPTVPTIAGPENGEPMDNQTFTVVTDFDQENDPVYYEIDWDMDGSGDQRIPGDGGVVSVGIPQSFTKSWVNLGTYSFKARACDNQGISHCSTWSGHTITIDDKCVLTVNVGEGGIVARGEINCKGAGTCTASLAPNTPVSLTQQTDEGYTFSGWNGQCSGTGDCGFNMGEYPGCDKTVSAAFSKSCGNCDNKKDHCPDETWSDGCGGVCSGGEKKEGCTWRESFPKE